MPPQPAAPRDFQATFATSNFRGFATKLIPHRNEHVRLLTKTATQAQGSLLRPHAPQAERQRVDPAALGEPLDQGRDFRRLRRRNGIADLLQPDNGDRLRQQPGARDHRGGFDLSRGPRAVLRESSRKLSGKRTVFPAVSGEIEEVHL